MKKYYSEAELWLKMTRWCDYQERCQQETRDKLYALGLHRQEVEQLLSKLISEGFVNEERFAIAYARGKFRISGWGRIKIKMALQQKKISAYCIHKAIALLPEDDYTASIRQLIDKKMPVARGSDERARSYAVAKAIIARGFEPPLVYAQMNLGNED